MIDGHERSCSHGGFARLSGFQLATKRQRGWRSFFVIGLFRQACRQHQRGFIEDLAGRRQHEVRVHNEHLRVPLHEELAVGGAPAALLVEESRLVRPDAVAARVVGAAQSPGGLVDLVGAGLERREHELVVALQWRQA